MIVFVVNLEKDEARLEHITEQLDQACLPFERMPGVYGKALSEEQLKRHYDEARAKWQQSRSLSRAEIGCSLSQLKIYREIARRSIPTALIFEDDAVVPLDLRQIVDHFEATLNPDDPIVVLLSEAETDDVVQETLLGDLELKKVKTGYHTSSYIITRAAAAALLAELYPVYDIPDPWIRLIRQKVLDVNAITPPLVVQDRDQFGSSTSEGIREILGSSRFALPLYKARRLRAVIWNTLAPRVRRRRELPKGSKSHPIDALFD